MAADEPANDPKGGFVSEGGARPVPADAPPQRPQIAIDEALRAGWFEFWYQPKIDLKRKYLAGAEAIARIRHPVHGVMPPGSFVPALGEGSIERLTEYSLLATLWSWAVFKEAGFNLNLAINVPVSALLALPIPDLVEQNRPRSDRWPGITLEVSEDQIARDVNLAQTIASRLQLGGIKIAIDNFGAGYSSLASLRAMPLAEIKINRDFVRDCAVDASNAAICQTVIDLAHRFGSAAVAEGVESQADLQALMSMGCDFGQGALFAPSMPQERFLALLLQRLDRPRANAQAEQAEPDTPPTQPMDRVA